MKKLLVWLLRLALLALPTFIIYEYVQNEDVQHDIQWWIDNAGYIAWALGSFLLLLFAASNIELITGAQLGVLIIGTVLLAYFYLDEGIYQAFLGMPFFAENKKFLPVIPYGVTAIILIIFLLFKRRYRYKAVSDSKH